VYTQYQGSLIGYLSKPKLWMQSICFQQLCFQQPKIV